MAITDQQFLTEIQRVLIEPADNGETYASGHWTKAEVIAYANHRQYEFLRRTKLVLKRSSPILDSPIGQHQITLPADWVASVRAAWKADSESGTPALYRMIPKVSSFDTDNTILTWQSTNAARPRFWMDEPIPTLKLQFAPAPSVDGSVELLYAALSTTLSNTGVAFTVPDEFVPGIKYGVLADMLKKTGRGQDLARATYAEGRYEEAVLAAQVLLETLDATA